MATAPARSEEAVSASPSDSRSADFQHAFEFHQRGDLANAESLYREILRKQPAHADALHFLGVLALQRGQQEAAADLIGRAITIDPANPASHYNLGIALHGLQRTSEALTSFDRALALSPEYVDALNNRGIALQYLQRYDEALTSLDRALALRPDSAEIHNNRGNVLRNLKRHDEALASYDCALAVEPNFADALNNRGDALQDRERYDEALATFDRALALSPDFIEALSNRGIVLLKLQRHDEALASFDRALALNPDRAEIHYNRGNVLQHLERSQDALDSYDRALGITPDYADALHNRGILLQTLKRYDDALTCYEHLLAIRPDYAFEFGNWLHTRMLMCNWTDVNDAFRSLSSGIDDGKAVVYPFPALATPLSLIQQRTCAEIYAREMLPPVAAPPLDQPRSPHGRIRLAYFSADFRDHPVAHLTAGLFETHDRSRFELIAFAFGPVDTSTMRTRLEAAFDQFIVVGEKSDREIAQLARTLGIDIAVDLMGFTLHSRTGIFAQRAAPIQVSYLGYPGTMGANYIDYLIADATIIPPEHAHGYTEKIASLPHTFQANDSKRAISDRCFTRREVGLPGQGFVYCNLNHCYKITPSDFDLWMGILNKVEGSVLWLAATNGTAERNLREEASARGIAPDRLIFKQRTESLADHLAQLRLADLFIDTYYFNAHTTASDALWAGLPVLTRLGQTYAGRVAASLLKAAGLPELITETPGDYARLAIELAMDAPQLAAIKERLATNRLTLPLFDTALFTRHIEAAYMSMWQRHQAGLPPEHIVIAP
jgi:predicted O-linked N-acetylglucosamine transferase (SPINDLY family)